VIAALGTDERLARGTIRFSLGRSTSADEIDRVIAVLPAIVAGLRELGTISV
jgi:cysteine desulfurase